MDGIFYGIGTGPGDPELITLKAVRVLEESPVISFPGHENTSLAFHIACEAVPKVKDKILLPVNMPMTMDKTILHQKHQEAKNKIISHLESGRNVAFLTLGDPCIYSTFSYLQKLIKAAGYDTSIINGIPSFCAASALLGNCLVTGYEQLHILPPSCNLKNSLSLPGTKILMKAGKELGTIKQLLSGLNVTVSMVENCGMENEKLYSQLKNIPDEAGYYSLLIVKEND